MQAGEMHGMKVSERKVAARNPDLDLPSLVALAKDQSWRVRVAVATNLALPDFLVSTLAGDANERVRAAVVAHPGLSEADLDRLATDTADEVRARAEVRRSVAQDADSARAAATGDEFHRTLSARSQVLDTENLGRLAGDDSDLVRLALARNPKAPEKAIVQLATDPRVAIRRALTAREDTPEIVWASLTKDQELSVRLGVASSEYVPSAVLGMLARRTDDLDVVRLVAANPLTPTNTLKRLGRHRRWDVRAAVVGNPSAPASVAADLATKSPWSVRAAIASSPHIPPRLLARYVRDNAAVAFALAGNPALPTEIASALLRYPNEFVSGRAAAHPAVAPHELATFVGDFDRPAWVLRAAAANPACPEDVSAEVLTWIAVGGTGTDNPTFDPVTCVGHPGDQKVTEWVWYRSVAGESVNPDVHPLWRVRATAVASRARVPYYLIELLARDPREEVRRTIARFDGMSKDVLQELCGDSDKIVATQARASLTRALERPKVKQKRRVDRRTTIAIAIAVSAVVSIYNSNSSDQSSSQDALTRLSVEQSVPTIPVPIHQDLPGGASAEVTPFSGVDMVTVQAGSGDLPVLSILATMPDGTITTVSGPFTISGFQQRQFFVQSTGARSVTVTYANDDGTTGQQTIEVKAPGR